MFEWKNIDSKSGKDEFDYQFPIKKCSSSVNQKNSVAGSGTLAT